MRKAILVGLLASLASCAMSASTTIYRDSYGVPSIVAPTFTDAMYGLGYMHFVDNGVRAALNYKIARGRSGEVLGKGQLLVDTFLRGFEIEDRAEKAELPKAAWDEIDAYIAGANKAIAERRDKLPAWVQPITRTDVLSLSQFVNCAFPLLDLSSELMPGVGSNQFAIGGKRTSTGSPILSIDPHLEWNGNDGGIVWYEAGIYCPGMNFRGVSIPGVPGCVMGHNDQLGWSITNNDPRLFVRYQVKTNPQKPNEYSYFGEWKEFRTKKVEMKFLVDGELKSQTQTLKLTEWGPMVPFRNESVYLEPLGNFANVAQVPEMMRSSTVEAFRKAMSPHGLSMWNFVAADTKGGLAYQYNAAIHKRDASIDWFNFVDGSDPKTRLGEMWTIDELPHSVNPGSNLLVNANSAPWLTPVGPGMSDHWPAYLTSYEETGRYRRLTDLLKANEKVDPSQAQRIATDTLVPYVARALGRLGKAGATEEGMEILKRWNKRSEVDSVGTALYLYILAQDETLTGVDEPDPAKILSAYQRGVAAMTNDFGRLDVKWGEVLRMKRGTRSLGVSGWGGIVAGAGAAVNPSGPGSTLAKVGGPITAARGSSFRMIVSLEPGHVQSWSVLPYGNSQDPTSPYYANQMDLFAIGRYKPTLFGIEAAKKGAVETIELSR